MRGRQLRRRGAALLGPSLGIELCANIFERQCQKCVDLLQLGASLTFGDVAPQHLNCLTNMFHAVLPLGRSGKHLALRNVPPDHRQILRLHA